MKFHNNSVTQALCDLYADAGVDASGFVSTCMHSPPLVFIFFTSFFLSSDLEFHFLLIQIIDTSFVFTS